jgi:sulfoxide reductase catalytic subunit YedY
MANVILPPVWRIQEREATPEDVYLTRRACLGLLGVGGLALAGLLPGCTAPVSEEEFAKETPTWDLSDADRAVYPAKRNSIFVLDRPLTPEYLAAQYNNFYEFSEAKDDVWQRVKRFMTRPWLVEIGGLVRNPLQADVDDFLKLMPIEERLYRHRCVEAWAMAVPWTGFPLKALIGRVEPLPTARFVGFTSFHIPSVAPGQNGYGPWPYTEGLTMTEATNELAFLATGIYGHPLPKQHGAPIRLVAPWKYGYKSIKSVVKIDFVAEQPATFWNTLIPHEYDFLANVNPAIAHPRWSQRTERLLGSKERRDTLYLNGYERWAAALYA